MTANEHARDVTDILNFLEVGENLGIQLPPHLKEKISKLEAVGSGKLKVALVGGFSEGKTSLAAAWLGMLPGDMKISQSESSNAVTIYDASDEVELVDTPGLFGFKESNISDGIGEKYKEMTRKYVSEADLLLYVLNPSNPLKESHKEELNWLFRELNLLSRTVFVIGRFDMVADVEDDADYARHLEIKKNNIILRLKDLVNLTIEEEGSLSIVGVAANPFDEGISSWFGRPDEYARLSHIGDLRLATAEKVRAIGGAEEAKRQTAVTILRDVTERLLLPARQAAEDSERQAAIAEGRAKEERPRLARYQREAAEAQIALRREVVDYFGDLITEAKNTDIDSFEEFFDRKIGADGVVVKAAITNMFTRELGPISQQLVTMSADFVATGSGGGAVTGMLSKVANKAKGVTINNTMILKARDWVMPAFKFRPYGAVKAARFANGALAGIGLVIEGWSMWRDHQKAEKFSKDRQAIVDDMNQQFSAILAQIDTPDFLLIYFPQIEAMRSLFSALAAAFAEATERNRKMQEWAKKADTLRLRFDGGSYRLTGESVTVDL
ncbi:labile enterotoxin output A [Novosphingobium sp. FSY-8]|uniref:Labile enterotoxin output A n=1 Tax=Novosphingobium ovatum TaxID=1908523 RepID=A0ABW9XAB9_9SPHN|nr:LeoA/HP0731 family dynamin-like GTPase [Novosphingobium ovatum]NBC35462.1 labile enterotoxin output A [Novosphingobium ovatum]